VVTRGGEAHHQESGDSEDRPREEGTRAHSEDGRSEDGPSEDGQPEAVPAHCREGREEAGPRRDEEEARAASGGRDAGRQPRRPRRARCQRLRPVREPGVDRDADERGGAGIRRSARRVERDLAKIRERDPEVADSALAASAVALAREIEHPFNSATSKSMCAGKLHEALDRLRELAPPKQEDDRIEDLAAECRLRLAGGTEA
jgi:hypothetical protein